jgi:hypothetical protein
LIPFFRKRYQFPVRNTKWLKNGKLRRAIFYNISQRNFEILLILWCSFKPWWNFCLDLSTSKFCSLGKRSIQWNTVQYNMLYIYIFLNIIHTHLSNVRSSSSYSGNSLRSLGHACNKYTQYSSFWITYTRGSCLSIQSRIDPARSGAIPEIPF